MIKLYFDSDGDHWLAVVEDDIVEFCCLYYKNDGYWEDKTEINETLVAFELLLGKMYGVRQ